MKKNIMVALLFICGSLVASAYEPDDMRVAPFMTGYKWGQGSTTGFADDPPCFNLLTPGQTNCGCVATAIATILHFNKWPQRKVRDGQFDCAFEGTGVCYRLAAKRFDWDLISYDPANATVAQRLAIATLALDVAIASQSQFATPDGGTIASIVTAYLRLKDRYYFASAEGLEFDDAYFPYDEEILRRMVIPCCEYGQPVLLSVLAGNNRHEILIDGYGYCDGEFVVHAIVGGNGYDDGWFRPPNFPVAGHDFNTIAGGIYGVMPVKRGTIVCGRAIGPSGDPIGGVAVTLVAADGSSQTTLSRADANGRGSYAFLVGATGTCHVVATGSGCAGSNTFFVAANDSPQVTSGGEVRFDLRPTVGNSYGHDISLKTVGAAPVETTATPIISGPKTTFSGSATVSLASSTAGAVIRYTLDGSDPDWHATRYAGPFAITDTTLVKARAWAKGCYPSATAQTKFTHNANDLVGDNRDTPAVIVGESGTRILSNVAQYTLEAWEGGSSALEDGDKFPHTHFKKDSREYWYAYDHTPWIAWTAPGSGKMRFYTSLVDEGTDYDDCAFLAVYDAAGNRLARSVGDVDADDVASGWSSGFTEGEADSMGADGSWGCDYVQETWCYLNRLELDVTQGTTYYIVLMSPASEASSKAFYYLKWKGSLVTTEPADEGDEPGPSSATRHYLTFNAQGGRLAEVNRLLADNEACGTLPTPTDRAGYTFDGWFTGESGGRRIGPDFTLASDAIAYAQWSAVSYPITYVLGSDQATKGDNPDRYTVEDEIELNAATPASGNHFTGWSPTDVIPIGSMGAKTFTAQWADNVWTLSFDANGGGVRELQRKVRYGASCGTLPVPTRIGHAFTGWYTKKTGGTEVTAETVVTSDTTLFAHWEAERFEIRYVLNGGENAADNPTSYTVEDEIVLKSPTRAGYAFDYWDPIDRISRLSLGTRTFTAHWRDRRFYISFDANGGVGEMDDIDIGIGVECTLPACTFTRAGYSFRGWAYEPNGEVKIRTFDTVKGDETAGDGGRLTLYAVWGAGSEWASVDCTVAERYQTGKAISPIAVSYGGGSTPKVTVKGLPSGLKWTSKAVTGKSGSSIVTNAAANTIYGTPAKSGVYTVTITVSAGSETAVKTVSLVIASPGERLVRATYDAAEGSVSGAGVLAAGKSITLKATAAKGYVFAGWYDGSTLLSRAPALVVDASGKAKASAKQAVVTAPAGDATYAAKFITAKLDADAISATIAGHAFAASATTAKTNVWAGVYLAWPVAAEALSDTTIKVSGLPAGLKFTAKDVYAKGSKTVVDVPANTIYGTPTGKSSTIGMTVTTAGKSVRTFQLTVTVDPLPSWAQGTFSGVSHAEDGTTNGTVSVTVASNGKISAKQPVSNKQTTFSAANFDRYDAASGIFSATLTAKVGKSVVTNAMSVWGCVHDATEACPQTTCGVIEADRFEAWQSNWKSEPLKSLGSAFNKKSLIYVIRADGSCSEDAEDLAQSLGDKIVGRVTLSFAANGTAKVAGEFVSGFDAKKNKYATVKATGSATLCPIGDDLYIAFVYLAPKGLKAHSQMLFVQQP